MGKTKRTKSARGNTDPEPTRPRSLARHRRWVLAAGLATIALGAGLLAYKLRADPRVFYLGGGEQAAQWIRNDEPMLLGIYRRRDWATVFTTHFTPRQAVREPRLRVRAFRRFEVQLDGVVIFKSPEVWDAWKREFEIPLGESISPHSHELSILVINRDAHPCLTAACPELGVRTSRTWLAGRLGNPQRAALLATNVVPPEIAGYFPSVADCFSQLFPWLVVLSGVALAAAVWLQRDATSPLAPWLTPATLRWCLLAAWIVLGANNIWRLDSGFGYDHQGHADYVKFIAENKSLPLATDGWQMFQAPLFYLLAAPWYALFSQILNPELALKALRVLPLACGLAQIELVYRVARAAFPADSRLQAIATLIGGLLPINVYLSQVVGNEPLAGCLTSLVVLLCVLLLVDPARPRRAWFFMGLGTVWGLALLAKVTPLVLAPLWVAAIVFYTRSRGERWQAAMLRVATTGAMAGLVAGWYFVRNLVYLGTPFTSGWGENVASAWWQDPGYRTWPQLTSFGAALQQPVYSGCWSFWDALYSTMWLDGFTSGRVDVPDRLPWNIHWMELGAWLGLVPTGLIIAGLCSAGYAAWRGQRAYLWFAAVAVVIYLAAVAERFLALPSICAVKSTYLLGVLPCLAILAAAGAEPIVRHRIGRIALGAALIFWAVATYAAYFSLAAPVSS